MVNAHRPVLFALSKDQSYFALFVFFDVNQRPADCRPVELAVF